MSMKGWFGKEMGKLFSKTRRRNSSKSKRRSGGGYEVSEDGASAQTSGGLTGFQQYAPIHTDAVTCAAVAGNGVCLTGAKDQTVCLYDFNTGNLKHRWATHTKDVTKVVYGPEMRGHFSASRDKTVCLHKEGSDQPQMTYEGHDLVVTALTLNQDSSMLCTGSRDNSVKLWDVQTGECTLTKHISRNLVTHVNWKGDVVVQSGEDKELRMYDSRTLGVTRTFPRKQYIQTWCELSVCGNYCVSSSNGFSGSGCEATLWDVRTSSIVHEFKGHYETCCCAVFLPERVSGGQHLIATSSNDCSVKIWDRDSKECLASLDLVGSGPVTSIAVFDDGRLCVSTFNTGMQVLQLSVHSSGVSLARLAAF